MISRSSAGGASARTWQSGVAASWQIRWMTAGRVSPAKARWPLAISNRMAPIAHTSVAGPIAPAAATICSGAMYMGVPTISCSPVMVSTPCTFEMPKSSRTARSPPASSQARKMFDG
jgi:hypothetical protein